MQGRHEIENLVEVKTSLAEKYDRLARTRKSKPWRKRLCRRAASYRRQAAGLAEELRRQ